MLTFLLLPDEVQRLQVRTGCVGHWDMLSDSTSDVNRDSEHRTRLTAPSSQVERKYTRMLFGDGMGVCFQANPSHPED